jgi:hypothetical protein
MGKEGFRLQTSGFRKFKKKGFRKYHVLKPEA